MSGEVNSGLDMMEAIQDWVGALNDGIAIDASASESTSKLQSLAMDNGTKWLQEITDHIKSITPDKDHAQELSEAQTEYQTANAKVNASEQQAGNLVQKSTTDVNNASSQQQTMMNMANSVLQSLSFINGLLQAGFVA